MLTDWAFATLCLGRVQVFVAPENLPALRLAERAGFQREGVLRSYWEIGGKRLDVVVFGTATGRRDLADAADVSCSRGTS